MMDDFLVRALLAGIGVAVMAGPLGCFVVWRRMAYFGDAMAHTALLGVALGFLLGLNLTIGMIAVSTVVAIFIATLQRGSRIAADTLLGIMAHTALSLGLIAVFVLPEARFDLMGLLFGDILSVRRGDILIIYILAAAVLLILMAVWRKLIALTVDEELARVDGIAAGRMRLLQILLLAAVIAMAMKVVGILLITSMLIIPAAAARAFARTPEQMASFAVLIGAAAVGAGLALSYYLDTPSGPTIVVSAAAFFAVSALLPPRWS